MAGLGIPNPLRKVFRISKEIPAVESDGQREGMGRTHVYALLFSPKATNDTSISDNSGPSRPRKNMESDCSVTIVPIPGKIQLYGMLVMAGLLIGSSLNGPINRFKRWIAKIIMGSNDA